MSCSGSVLLLVLYKFASTKNLFKYLRLRYSHQHVQELNKVIRLKGKQVRTQLGILFLKTCLEQHVVPTNIRERVAKTKPKHPYGIEKAFMRDELDKKMDFLEQTKEEYKAIVKVCAQLSYVDRLRFCKLLNQTTDRLSHQVKTKNDKTVRWLIKSQLGQGVLRHSTIINLSDVELTEIQKDVLCRGLNFGIPPAKLSHEAVIAEFEMCWQQLEGMVTSDERRATCKTSLANIAQRYASAKIDRTGYPLGKEHMKTIKELRQNHDVIITRPDKGNGVVIMNRTEYVEKMTSILSQTDKFQRIGDAETYDHTTLQERALQAFLLRATKNGHISREIYDEIRPVGSTRPRMYGVPKIHKDGNPLRPILSMVNAPQHQMAKWLTRVLQPVVQKYSQHVIKDTFEFCDNVEAFAAENNTRDMFMCSFDVVSLFTNIPLQETIKICLDSLYRDPNICPPPQPEELLRKMLMKATTEVEFSFDGIMYRQVDGVAMGSPLGPVLANIFVGQCESLADQLECEWPLLYNRFVDDTFAIFAKDEQVETFFNVLNNLHPALQFTVERENDGRLPFMDVLVQRTEGHLLRSVYRKPTFTGLYTRWDSFAPTQQKISLLKSLVSRAKKICSESTLSEELAKLKVIFADNGYPTHIIDRIIKQLTSSKVMLQQVSDDEMKPVFIKLPWIGSSSTAFGIEIRQAIVKGFRQAQPRVIFTTTKAFSGRAKDVLPATHQSSVIYEFTCSCELTYVGKTTQCLAERMKQHLPEKLFGSPPELRKTKADSAITRHVKDSTKCRSQQLLSNFKVIARARHQQHLDVLEALHIRSRSPKLCQQKDHVTTVKLV